MIPGCGVVDYAGRSGTFPYDGIGFALLTELDRRRGWCVKSGNLDERFVGRGDSPRRGCLGC